MDAFRNNTNISANKTGACFTALEKGVGILMLFSIQFGIYVNNPIKKRKSSIDK